MQTTHNRSRVLIRKENIKFASAHMTVFKDGSKEALHGHGFQVALQVELKSLAFQKMISFSEFKKCLRVIAAEWDEKVLLAVKNPHFKLISKSTREIEFKLCGKRYVLPSDEVVLLAIDNVTTERLAEEFCVRLKKALSKEVLKGVSELEVTIEESPGQGASFAMSV